MSDLELDGVTTCPNCSEENDPEFDCDATLGRRRLRRQVARWDVPGLPVRILDWECYLSPDGNARAATHAENGTVTYIGGRLIAHGDAPAEVLRWLIRPLLRVTWDQGRITALREPRDSLNHNPYIGEPPNKDKDVS